MQQPREPFLQSATGRTIIILVSVGLILLILGVSAWLVTGNIKQGQQAAPIAHPTKTASGAQGSATVTAQTSGATSPLLFGTNLGLFNANDQVIQSTQTQQLMQKMHVRIVRMPSRKNLPAAIEIQAAQAIKNIGATPLIALHGLRNPTALADNIRIVQDMNSVFGNERIYYEFGNEDDYNGIPIDRYTMGWNQIIPQLKKIARNAHFVGPVSYQYDRANLTTFLQGANPRPDEISWHEYTCSYKDPSDNCLTNIDNWTTHITDARDAMQTTLGTVLPIMITEWNYAPDQSIQNNGQPFADGKYNNSAFITAWTTKAFKVLATNHVFASMQYTVTNTALPMITYNNTLTTQGTTFQGVYEQMIGR